MYLGNIDIKDSITFEQATQLANVETGDSMSVALGKLSKLYATLENTILNSDLKPNTILQTNNTGKISSSDISKDLLTNLKMVHFGQDETKLTLFLNAQIGITPICTNESTPYKEIPSGAPEWKYATGMILKRTNEIGNIVLYSYQTGKVGIVSTGDSGETWSDWSIDKEDIAELLLSLNPSGFDFKLKKFVDATCSSHIDVLKKHWNEAFDGAPAARGYRYRVVLTNYGSSNVIWTCCAYQNKLYGYALCFSHPNSDVSNPQFYTISNGTWSDRNELVKSSDLSDFAIITYSHNIVPRLPGGMGDAADNIITIPAGYYYLSYLPPTVDHNQIHIYNILIGHPNANKISIRTNFFNRGDAEAKNFTIAVPLLFLKSI